MKVEIPESKSEFEEARWWFENQDRLADAYGLEHPLSASLDVVDFLVGKDDAEFALKEAQKRSIAREQYLREVLQEALRQRRAA